MLKLTCSIRLPFCRSLEQITFVMYLVFPKKKITSLFKFFRLEFEFSEVFGVTDYLTYALDLTSKQIITSSDGQRRLELC